VREGSALSPRHDRLGVAVHDLEQLADQAALADAGDADERDELRRAFAPRSSQRVDQEPELARAPDQRGPGPLFDVETEPGARGDRLPNQDRLGLALRGNG